MNSQNISLLLERAKQINEETHRFVEKCELTIQDCMILQGETAWLIEKSMVLKEEALADRCKSLAICKLASEAGKFIDGADRYPSSINEDISIALQMLEEIKQASISSTNPLHTLRSELLALSFLPLDH